jgi:hypothetical protein
VRDNFPPNQIDTILLNNFPFIYFFNLINKRIKKNYKNELKKNTINVSLTTVTLYKYLWHSFFVAKFHFIPFIFRSLNSHFNCLELRKLQIIVIFFLIKFIDLLLFCVFYSPFDFFYFSTIFRFFLSWGGEFCF